MTDNELLEQSERRRAELDENIRKLKTALATKELLEDGSHRILINIEVTNARADVTGGFDAEELERYVSGTVDMAIASARLKLEKLGIGLPDRFFNTSKAEILEEASGATAADEADEAAAIDEAAEAAVVPEAEKAAPAQQKEKQTSKDILTDAELRRRYFKLGQSVKTIAASTGLGEAGLYKRLENMKKSIEANAKEFARQGG